MQWRHTKGYTDLPTADNATVGFLVSLKYKNQKSEVQFTCHQSPGAFSPSVHTSFLSVETWVRSALRALKRNVKRDLFSSRRWTFSATSIGSVSVSLSLYLSFSLSLCLCLYLDSMVLELRSLHLSGRCSTTWARSLAPEFLIIQLNPQKTDFMIQHNMGSPEEARKKVKRSPPWCHFS
jgi:hypothetical protein